MFPTPTITFIFIFLVLVPSATQASEEEQRLYADLLNNYNNLERPVANASEPLIVKVRLFLQQIIDVDEKDQVVQVNAWIRYIWYDYKLQWNPADYGGISDVRFLGSLEQIWKPDILLYNSADENFDTTYKSNQIVYNSGEVMWIPPGILKFTCPMVITWFPFDDQICDLKFGSWTYNGHTLDLQIDSDNPLSPHQMDLSDYVTNGEWGLVATPAKREEKIFECCPEPYYYIVFSMHIRRRTLFYWFNLIIPSLLISVMTIFSFCFPPDAGEKMTLEITILLSVCFFLSMVGEMTPATSDAVPLIGIFFSTCMLVIAASVIFTVVILNLHFRAADTHIMAPLLRKVLLEWMPWMLMMARPGYRYHKGRCIVERPRVHPFKHIDAKIANQKAVITDAATDAQIIMLHRLNTELKEITNRMFEEEEKEAIENDWRFAAMVVDRACLILFSIFITACVVAFIACAPHIIA
uniref:Uncharacterized protein n=1 Tax=Panagrellus redivivus TaxID=6233 RepID=A0A7E4V3N5_PANRE